MPLDRRILANINWWLILLVMILCFAGIVNIYSATAESDSQAIRSAPRLQTRWVGIGLVVMFFVMALDYNRLVKGAFLLHFMGCIGLLAVLFFPSEAAGVRRWLNLGIVRFQPSERAASAREKHWKIQSDQPAPLRPSASPHRSANHLALALLLPTQLPHMAG